MIALGGQVLFPLTCDNNQLSTEWSRVQHEDRLWPVPDEAAVNTKRSRLAKTILFDGVGVELSRPVARVSPAADLGPFAIT